MTIEKLREKYAACFRERDEKANKGTYGRLLIIAGSPGMAGAAYLSGLAAFKCGIGMVKYFGPEENRTILQTLLPEAMYHSYGPYKEADFGGAGREETKDSLRGCLLDDLKWADYCVVGPGLSVSETSVSLVKSLFKKDMAEILRQRKLLVIDADALNIISREGFDLKILDAGKCSNVVVTPHIVEMKRLIQADMRMDRADVPSQGIAQASAGDADKGDSRQKKAKDTPGSKEIVQEISGTDPSREEEISVETIRENAGEIALKYSLRHGVITVLKDDTTIVSDGRDVYRIASGSGAMAKAGSGDVLTGFLAGTVAVLKGDTLAGVPLGVYSHGVAGKLAGQRLGPHSILSRDIALWAGAAFACLSDTRD